MLSAEEDVALAAFSRGEMGALELRRRLGGASFGEVLRRLGDRNLPLPRAPTEGRETQLSRAHAWLFPSHAA